MRHQTTTLGIMAFTLAVAGAYATSFTPATVYIKARINSPSSPIVCYDTGYNCEDAGSNPCRVQINVAIGQNNTRKTYKNQGCTMEATTTTIPLIISTKSVYKLTEIQ